MEIKNASLKNSGVPHLIIQYPIYYSIYDTIITLLFSTAPLKNLYFLPILFGVLIVPHNCISTGHSLIHLAGDF